MSNTRKHHDPWPYMSQEQKEEARRLARLAAEDRETWEEVEEERAAQWPAEANTRQAPQTPEEDEAELAYLRSLIRGMRD